MMFQDFIQAVATLLDTTPTNAGIFLSLIVTIMIFIIIEIAAQGKGFEINGLIIGLFCTILFSAMGWLPIWTGSVIALLLAIVTGWYVTKMGGKG